MLTLQPEHAPRVYAATCEGKEQHATKAAARAAMQFYQVEGALRTGDGLEPYECPFCPNWHLGHHTRR